MRSEGINSAQNTHQGIVTQQCQIQSHPNSISWALEAGVLIWRENYDQQHCGKMFALPSILPVIGIEKLFQTFFRAQNGDKTSDFTSVFKAIFWAHK